MKNTQLNSMLDLQTNVLAGLFIMFVIVAVKVGTGGGTDGNSSQGQGKTKSQVEYQVIKKQKKDHDVQTVYIEFDSKNAKALRLKLIGDPHVLDSCSLGYSPFLTKSIWTGNYLGKERGDWSIVLSNPETLQEPVNARVHLLSGTQHVSSHRVTITKEKLLLFSN